VRRDSVCARAPRHRRPITTPIADEISRWIVRASLDGLDASTILEGACERLVGAARYAWARLLARIYEVFPLLCPLCGADMRIIAFITDASTTRAILVHLGEPPAPPRIAPARGPPLWDLPDAGAGTFDPHARPAAAYEFDQRIAWQPQASAARRAPRRAGARLRPPRTRRGRADACKTPAPAATVAPPRPRSASASRRSGQIKTCDAARDDASWRWISYP